MKRAAAVCLISSLTFMFFIAFTPVMPSLAAQAKPAITRADYGQWEALAAGGGRGGGGGVLSPDGQWAVYGINRSSRSNELRATKIADGTTKTVAFGSQGTFSSDSKWLAYAIGQSEAEQERLRTANRPVQNSLGVLNLATGDMSTVEHIESFAFSADGRFLAMRTYPPAPPTAPNAGGAPARGGGGRGGAGRGGGGADETPAAASLTVRELATGRDTTFGNVSEYAWQDAKNTHLLAMTISADGQLGNGVQLFDPTTTVLRVLDSSPVMYAALSWRKDAPDLAVLRATTDDRHDGPSYTVLAWSSLGPGERLRRYEPSKDDAFPAGMRIVSFRRPSWSDDGSMLFVGYAHWDDKPPTQGRAGGRGANAEAGRGAAAPEADEPAGVDIWHWQDTTVMAKQKLDANTDRRRNMLAVWHVDSGKLVPLAKTYTETVTPLRHTNLAMVAEWSAYAMDRSIGRPAADLYLADLATGTRTRIKDDINDRYVQVSPSGKYLLFLLDDQYWTINLATHAITNITKSAPTSFIDKDSDDTIKQKPPFGVAGWIKGDTAVVLYDKYDLWRVSADGSGATRLTNGAVDEVRHRYVRLDPDEDAIDPAKPIFVSLFGYWSKKSGYGVIRPASSTERLVWLDESVGSLSKARDAETYAYVTQDYDTSPNLFVGGPGLAGAKPITTTNAFQPNYAWGKSEIVEYKTDKGLRLQGALYYPAGYEPGKRYPMIVYMYEKLSDNVHQYVVPSDTSYYNTSVFTAQGYFVFQPDIVFRPRQPGLSVVECVTAGVKKVTSMGAVDPARVGVIGHSWGGFDSAFIATHTNGLFAAAIAGAPITDLVSNYGNHHWSSGIAETDHIETGQQRMEVPLYEDLPDYIANSAVFNVQNMTVPLLLECGDADGTVFWHQSVELFNIARRAKKNVVMLVYNGEDHGLRQRKNQVDYQQRILAWFGHYLKGETAAEWISHGEGYLERADEVKKSSGG